MWRHSWHCGLRPAACVVFACALCPQSEAGPPANDRCATPQVLSGTGLFPFDNCEATTGPEGQNSPGCGQPATYFDLWYCWTAPCTGIATVSTCGGATTGDSKIAVYLGGCACPDPLQSPDYCNDDFCGLQSQVQFDVICGQQYMLQIGSYSDVCWQGEFLIQCEGDPCDPEPPEFCQDCCGTPPAFTGFPGTVAVMTQQGSPATNSFDVIDISNQASAPTWPTPGNWWGAAFYSNTNPTNWSQSELGTVFGVTLDSQGNIYLAHSSVYGDHGNVCASSPAVWTFGDMLGSLSADATHPNGQPGAIYRIDTNTGAASLLTALPNFSDPAYSVAPYPANGSESYPGLGNICYDCAMDNLYVSNHEDGGIYRLTTSGTVLSAFVHGTGFVHPGNLGVPNTGNGFVVRSPHSMTGRGQRVWAVRGHQGRLYYSVWREHNCSPDGLAGNEVWSIDLVDSGPNRGEFIPGTERLEIDMANYPYFGTGPGGSSSPIADISFSPDCCMLIGERAMITDTISDAHESRLLEFCFDDVAGAWFPSPNTFVPGHPANPNSCAGGVDYDFDTTDAVMNVWTTADAIRYSTSTNEFVYGLIGLPFTGNTASVQGIWIDSDQDTNGADGFPADKWKQGDVEISCPTACGTLNDITVRCVSDENGWTGCWDYTFTFTNRSRVDVHYVLITDPNVDQRLIWLPTAVAHGQTSDPITIRICVPQDPPDSWPCYPLHISLADVNREECCAIDKCVTVPDCYCIEVLDVEVTGPSMDFFNYSLTFSFTNLTPDTLEHMYISAEPAGSFSVTPNYIDLPSVAPGTNAVVGPFKVNLGFLAPNTEYRILVSVHNEDLEECCSKVIRFTTPADGGFPNCPADFNGDGQLDFFDVQIFLNYFSSGDSRGDFNADEVFNFYDVQTFLNAFSTGCP